MINTTLQGIGFVLGFWVLGQLGEFADKHPEVLLAAFVSAILIYNTSRKAQE